jgi:hypothetical protein
MAGGSLAGGELIVLEAQFSDAARSRSTQTTVWLEATKLALIDAEPVEIARQLRARAEQVIRPKK